MSRRVRFHADFQADLRAQLGWLVEHRDESYIAGLEKAIDDAVELVSRFPAVGTIEITKGTVTLRRLILRKVPYLIWFLRDSNPESDVWMLRLFHARQDRPRPSLPGRRSRR